MNDEFQHSEASKSETFLKKIRKNNLSVKQLKNIISEAKKNEDFDAQTLSEVKRFLEEPRKWQEKRSQ